jgi:GAF domain-containing protein
METGTSASRFTGIQTSGLLIALSISLLLSIYWLISLPGNLATEGNVQNLALVKPVLTKLYISLAVTLVLAFVTIYLEKRNKRTVIVYREKKSEQTAETKTSSASARNLTGLTIKAVTGNNLASGALQLLAKEFEAVAGACYRVKTNGDKKFAELESGFALPPMETDTLQYPAGEGLVGQVVKNGATIYLDELPEGYVQAFSGLGQASPRFVLLTPITKSGQVTGVLEIATFKPITPTERQHVQTFANEIGERLN